MEKKSLEARKNEIAGVMEKLEQGVKDVFVSGHFAEYLQTMSRFHGYSLNNMLLIHIQRPDASLVAGYNAWQDKFHRHVKKGEKGIRILAPCPVKKKESSKEEGTDEAEETESRIFFRAVTVFDISQTEGEPLPNPYTVRELDGKVDGYEELMVAICACTDCPVAFEDIQDGAKGYYSPAKHSITIQKGMPEAQTLKTLLHEIAHSILHSEKALATAPKDRDTKEVEAESVAFVVSNALGLDTSAYSFEYVCGWSGGKELPELRSSLDTIRATSAALIEQIEVRMAKSREERIPA